MNDDEDTVEYDLVMPFVVCESQGGPYQDEAFVAGYELGLLSATLADKPEFLQTTVRTDSLKQVDLIAMKHGYVLRHHVMPVPEWTQVELIRTTP